MVWVMKYPALFLILCLFGCNFFDPPVQKTDNHDGYKYSKDLVTPHAERWTTLLKSYKGKSDVQYLEIGVYEGRATIWMLDNILTHETSSVTAIDNFYDKTEKILEHNIKHSGHERRFKLITGYSQQKLRELPLNHFDIIYIDGSHKNEDVLSDAVQAWEILKPGGIMIFDDYGIGAEQTGGPQKAIDAFVDIFKPKLNIVWVDYQYFIQKK